MHDATRPDPHDVRAAWLGAERLDVYRDILARLGRINALDHARGRTLLMRAVQMLTRLSQRFVAQLSA